jgi:hypothetical protein
MDVQRKMLLKSQIDPSLFWSDETIVSAIPKSRKLVFWVHSTFNESDRPSNPTVQGGHVLGLLLAWRRWDVNSV